jgi:hypothetical protein
MVGLGKMEKPGIYLLAVSMLVYPSSFIACIAFVVAPIQSGTVEIPGNY